MTTRMPPGELAQVDQDQARLRDLAAAARRHHRYCPHPHACPGAAAEAVVEDLDCAVVQRLLLLAIAERATRDYKNSSAGGAR